MKNGRCRRSPKLQALRRRFWMQRRLRANLHAVATKADPYLGGTSRCRAEARREGRDRLGCAGTESSLLIDEIATRVSITGETHVLPSLLPHRPREMGHAEDVPPG